MGGLGGVLGKESVLVFGGGEVSGVGASVVR